MKSKSKTKKELLAEIENLRVRLQETEEILESVQKQNGKRLVSNELETRVQDRTAEVSKAYKELEDQSRILDSFFRYNMTPFVVLDKDFNFLRVNEAYAKTCQRNVSDFPGHNHFEFYPHEENEAIFRHVVETKTPYQAVAKPFVFPDHPEWGETYWDWTLTPILKASGEVEFLVFSLRDVTGRERTQRKLVEQVELLDLAHDGILVRDMDGRITYWSRGAEKMYGWTKEEAMGKVVYELLQTRFPAPLEEIEACILEKGRWSGEIIHTERNGKEILVDSRWALQRDEQGRPARILGINTDITERKRAEETIHLQASQHATMLSTTPDGFWIFDTAGKLLDINDRYCQMSGYSREELLGFHISDLEALETPEDTARHIRRVMETGFDRFESQHRTKDGRILDVEISVSFWRATGRFLLFVRDITESKRAEKALMATHRYNRSLIETSLDLLVTISADGKITDANRATELITGVSRNDLIGTDFSDYFTEPETARKGYKKVFSEGTVRDYPLAIRHQSGRLTEVLYNATVYRSEDGEIQGVFAAARDVTEHNEIERRTYATSAILNLFSKISVKKKYLDAAVDLLGEWSRCRCVGIRVLDEQRHIPYESYVGFDEDFWRSENWLSVDHDQCACIRVVKEKPDPQDAPMMTPAGSFHCNNILNFVGRLSEEEKARYRGGCVRAGFKSIGIIPIRHHDKVFGAIHLADEREGMVPAKTIDFIESIAPLIGEAVQRFSLEAELKRNYETQNTINSLLRLSLEDVPLEEFLEGTLDLLTSNPYFSSELGGCIFLIEEENPSLLMMKAHRGLSARMIQSCRRVPLGHCLCGQAALTKKSRFTDCSASVHETGWGEIGRHAHHHVPILSGQRLLGIINLYLKEGHRPDQEEENFLIAIANTLAGIITRRHYRKALEESENRLKVLSAQLLTVQENERRHIAREIHDSIGQSLSAIKFTVENILQQAPKESSNKKADHLRSLIPLIKQSIEESRRIQMDLRPSILDDLGILATISWSCREFQKTYSGIYVEKQIDIQENEVPATIKTVIYRIIQEALNNISKHSQAYLVSLSLKKREGSIELTVQDNGQGFDLREALSRDNSRRGMGLGSMRERAELSGGFFELESVRGKGTTIRVTWKI